MLNNQTIPSGFQIVAFATDAVRQPLLLTVFLLIYLTGVLENAAIITLILIYKQLHTPMYSFLWNLSAIDIGYLTITLPKLMYILHTGDNVITFIHCFTQMYLYNSVCSAEIILLSIMAYDRYVAICNPLRYHLVMNKKKIVRLLCVIWVCGCLNSLFLTISASQLLFCHSNKVHHFYCDSKAVAKSACSNRYFYIILYVECSLYALLSFLLTLSSYFQIINTILHIRSTNSRKKAFSTCTSHLTVLTIFYGTMICAYMAPTEENVELLNQVLSVLYTVVTPMLNPLIYSLRNKDIISALFQFVGKRK